MTPEEVERNKLRHELILAMEDLLEITGKYPKEFEELRTRLVNGMEAFVKKVYEND